MFELEARFYYGKDESSKIISMLKEFKNLVFEGEYYEETLQFDNCDGLTSFYSDEIDGRFRVRLSESDIQKKLKISWKRRLKENLEVNIHKEEEVELDLVANQYDNLIFILTKVLKMKNVESYERYRNIFSNKEVEIVVDIYPFATAIEIESKKGDIEVIKKWVKKLNLNLEEAYNLSWDDKYEELCQEQGIVPTKFVTFDSVMPELKKDF